MVEKKRVEKVVAKPQVNKKKLSFKEWWAKTVKFFRDVRIEMKKVVWPSQKQVVKHTIVVLTFTLFFTVFILLADLIYDQLIFKLLLKIK